jgi:DUF2889 family protein
MDLDVTGHPLHSRAFTVVLVERADGRLDLQASILDLRKRGFVPVAGDLQGPGIVHHMQLAGIVDPTVPRLDTVAAAQPNVAFEPSAVTGGESCRDPIRRIEALAGAALDADFARRLGAEIGGNRGCSHLLTLAQLTASTVAWALAHDPVPGPRRPGERRFRRDLVIDGHEPAAARLQMAVQLTDLHFAPAPPVATPMARFGAERTLRLRVDVDLGSFVLEGAQGAERYREATTLDAPWASRADALAGLPGLGLSRGASAELFRRFGEAADDRPLLDALLMLAPALIQCVAANSEPFATLFQSDPSLVAMGGLPDSCYMWRRDGALQRTRPSDPKPTR